MNEAAYEYTKGESGIALRPVVSSREVAPPRFEVSACSAWPVVDNIPDILNFLDDSLPTTYRGNTRVSFSLGDREVSDKSFPEYFLKEIQLQNIEPARIGLEIRESAVLSETAWQRVIPELAGYGFRVVINRYIADNSGFDILASPHIAAIKVAPQVVAELPGSILARRFLKGLQALANAINKQLIVDGVETLGQALWLQAMGCETFQGSFYGPAIDARNARRFVLEGRQHASPIVFEPITD